MSTRYGDRGFGRYGDSDEDRTEDRDYEREGERGYGDPGVRYGPGADYGMSRRGGHAAGRGGDYRYERDYGYGRDYGQRYGARDYSQGEYGLRYGRELISGGRPRRHEDEEYGRDYSPRGYGRDYGRGRGARGPEGDEVREYDTDYGRTTSRFYGRSGYEYGRDDYDRDDERDERRGYAPRGDERGRGGRGWWDRATDEVLSWFGGEEDERRGRPDDPRAARGRGEGKFRGLGPRNYRRSDERIREEVCDRLTDNEWLDASGVEVGVAAGEVILGGTVDSRYAKRLAESIAESVSGVRNVQNSLRVHNYQESETTAAAPAAGSLEAPGATTSADTAGTSDPTATGRSSRAAGGS